MQETRTNLLAKNTLYLYARMIIVMVVSLYTSRVVLKTLGFEDFGIYNVVGSVVVFLSFLENALTNATYRYLAFDIGAGNGTTINNTYSMAINSHILLSIVLLLIMEAVGIWFVNHELNIPPDRMYAANVVFQFSLFNFCIGVLKTPFTSNVIAHEKMNFYAIISVIEVLLKLCLVILLYYSPYDKLISYAILQFGAAVVVFIGLIVYNVVNINDTRYIKVWDSSLLVKFLSYSGWSLVVNGAAVSFSQCLSIFFNWFVGVIGNAALGVSNQVNNALNQFVVNFSQAFNPQIIKSYASNDWNYFNKLIFSASKISFILFLIVSLPIVINIEFVLSVWLGDYPSYAPSFIRIVIISYLIDSCQNPLMAAVHATGNIKVHQMIVGSIKLISIPILYFVMKHTGNPLLGLSVFSGQTLICAIARTIYIPHLINFNLRSFLYEVILKLIILALITIPVPFIVRCLMGATGWAFVISTCISWLFVFVVSYFYVLSKYEKCLLNRLPIFGIFFTKINKVYE